MNTNGAQEIDVLDTEYPSIIQNFGLMFPK